MRQIKIGKLHGAVGPTEKAWGVLSSGYWGSRGKDQSQINVSFVGLIWGFWTFGINWIDTYQPGDEGWIDLSSLNEDAE